MVMTTVMSKPRKSDVRLNMGGSCRYRLQIENKDENKLQNKLQNKFEDKVNKLGSGYKKFSNAI